MKKLGLIYFIFLLLISVIAFAECPDLSHAYHLGMTEIHVIRKGCESWELTGNQISRKGVRLVRTENASGAIETTNRPKKRNVLD